MSYTKDYDTPDEKLSYSELKDRIREECARVLPRKERILLVAKKLECDKYAIRMFQKKKQWQ